MRLVKRLRKAMVFLLVETTILPLRWQKNAQAKGEKPFHKFDNPKQLFAKLNAIRRTEEVQAKKSIW